MLRAVAASKMFSTFETSWSLAPAHSFLTSERSRSSLVLMMWSSLRTIPLGSRSTGMIVIYSKNLSTPAAGSFEVDVLITVLT